ncbi:MAG: cation:proton antiporter [Candidatus Methanomethylophilaceae archaeon]|nr:cation:proton antiporter [Candidatus Methanomethylophilaceae archaeon]
MDEVVLIASMATLVLLAAFLSIVMSRLKFPPLIGFLAAGIIIANYLNIDESGMNVVEVFSELGLIMLMFSIGMEIDLRKLKKQGRFAIVVALVQLPLMVIGGVLAGTFLGFDMLQSICLGCIISGSSTAVVMAVLKSQGTLDKENIETLVLITIMEDIGQVIMLSMLTPMLVGSEMSPDDLALLIIQIAIFMVACFTAGLLIVPRVIDWMYKRSNDELISLLCLGGLFTLCYAGTRMGLSVAIGAFLMGIIVGTSRPKDAVEHFVEPLKSLFMAMFFISVGMEVTLSSLADNIVLIFIIFAVFAVCKSATVYLGYWVGNGDSRIGFLSAISLCAMGEFAFIIAKQALDNGVVDINFYSSVIGAALVSMITLPIFTRYADRAFTGLEKHTPGPLKKVGNKLTAIRDSVYASLENVAAGTKEAFSNGLANIYFNVFLLIIIEVLFYFSYDIASEWLVTHFGGNEVWWRTGIVAINFLVLLIPCRGIILSLRMVLYIMDLGKKRVRETMDLSEDETKFYEVINPIILASALDILIIIVVPNNLGTIYHVVVAVVVLIALVMYHLWKLIIKQKGPALPDLPYERKEEEQSPKEH